MIYCVEDDESIREIELYALRSAGFEALGFPDGESFFAALRQKAPALVILDVMLPGTDGVAILGTLRHNAVSRDIPVIMATAKGAEYDKVQSLDLGADDYLVKPFGMMEMLSRVKAVLRRSARGFSRDTLSCGGVELNTKEHRATLDGETMELTLKEYELLRLFMTNPGTVFTRDMLLCGIWGMDYDGETRTVDVHIRTLRQKLGRESAMIATVRGVGYRMEAPK